MEVLTIIPARGGSKGVPRKNLALVNGLPLIQRTVRAARHSSAVSRVVVSTEDPQIAAAAREAGAEIVERPLELAGDAASSEAVLLQVLEVLAETEGYRPELVVFMQCTSPLTTAADVDGAIDALLQQQADCALTVAPSRGFLWRVGEQGAEGINHDHRRRLRRQERELEFLETGAVYVMRTEGLKRARHRFFGKIAMFEVPEASMVEVDTPFDLQIARVLAEREDDPLDVIPAGVEALVLDFDGVFTDNRVTVHIDGTESVSCHRGDGMGITLLHELKLPMLVLSSEQNPIVRRRCEKLRLECIHGVESKLSRLRHWAKERQIDLSKTVFVGNDENDIACLREVGCGVVVRDAHPAARDVARLVLRREGGDGAIRELADLLRRRIEADQEAGQ
jgi:YrbI family 3-deoxy-D-manno-octulosonate 8-phosphate phosphatase